MSSQLDPVVVIGAGPVGLFTALLVAQSGIKVIVYESEAGIDQSPGAVEHFPAVLEEFSKAGILEAIIATGEKNQGGCDWRDKDGNIIGGLDPPPDNPYFAVNLSQPELCQVILDAVIKTGNAHIHFNHTIQRLQQQDGFVDYWVTSNTGNHEVQGRCQYLVGADGGRSTVRRNLGIDIEGYTWESWLFVAVNFQYSLGELGWKATNFIVDPEDWGFVVKRGQGTSWRMITGVHRTEVSTAKANTLDEATIKVVKNRLCRLLPGDTSSIQYEAMVPYVVHQHCASSFVKGNVLLAGDAAHLNNPVGGLALTAGLLDAAHLAGSLRQVLNEGAGTEVLISYAETRQRIFRECIDPITTANLLRLMSEKPEDINKRERFFEDLNSKDLATATQVSLSDFALTSTSDTKFDTYHEVTWFISVTKPDGWEMEKFVHEYKTVHSGMTRQGKEHGSPLQHYIQLSNTNRTMQGGTRPEWNYVTCLTFPSLFITYAGFQDPGYRATAGAHIFCRLDQQGCLAKQVAKFSRGQGKKNDKGITTRILLFHDRSAANDEYSQKWLQKRSDDMASAVATDENSLEYVLWQDMTPKKLDFFFRDTQFSGGSWHNYKAVEAFDFDNEGAAVAFLDRHTNEITENSSRQLTVVIGERDDIVTS
ncbi:uncharacterized protein NECHADRAFT_74387 [Fusarium vanettenii 77-13-4]|uniref:FAD-binding domain-containing protein n=1 Tax=Fusarium vanettenii (strain ATCC MYA-4622 / CBS 123669 / FGSC 9596 / NRRL 45880 / 77-13-4) TaxID=660122 RepID=C7ZRJ3_FUSV7|nr:uncharacterized protein NECHADRAFT_74387 [Fusarium vanettenii 77-13-4]EEU33363.1 hypothetical protein NECHADRAFT_74387 [Fusarium vanettenii 77-13-4]